MMKKRVFALLILFLFAFTVVSGCVVDGTVAEATQYGSKTTDDENTFWYYFGEGNLNIAGLKQEIAKWDLSNVKNPIVIALIDTGVNVNHDVFSEADVLYKKDGVVQAYNSYAATNSSNPTAQQLINVVDGTSDSHGTAMASIMAMLIHELGLDDYIKIYPIKASEGSKKSFALNSVIHAIDYVQNDTTIGFDVVNLALCSYSEDWKNYEQKYINLSSKCVIVAAAGNGDDTSAGTYGYSTTDKPGYPASLKGVLSVMAYQKSGDKTTASNYGNYDLIAPGGDVYCAKGTASSYQTLTGTSMASAFMSVVAGLVKLRTEASSSSEVTIDANIIANHIRTSYSTYINYNGYQLKKFNATACIKNAFSDNYIAPYSIEIVDDGTVKRDSITDLYKNKNTIISLTASLLPYNSTNPILDNDIVWKQVQILKRTVQDENGIDKEEEYESEGIILGYGKTLNYKPEVDGTYKIYAIYTDGETTLTDYRAYKLHYVSYDTVAGDVEVVAVGEENNETPTKSFSVYTDDSLTFTLTYLDCVDNTVEIKWFVNGEYVSSGTTFEFIPTEEGNYTITAQYGDYRKVEKVVNVEVSSSILKTEKLVPLICGCAIVFIAIVSISAVLIAKKIKSKKQNQ